MTFHKFEISQKTFYKKNKFHIIINFQIVSWIIIVATLSSVVVNSFSNSTQFSCFGYFFGQTHTSTYTSCTTCKKISIVHVLHWHSRMLETTSSRTRTTRKHSNLLTTTSRSIFLIFFWPTSGRT